MKLIVIILFACCTVSLCSNAQTWNGTMSSNWNDPNNWTPNAVPNSNSNVVINNVGFSPKLQSNASVGVINLNAGVTLDFNGYALSVTSNINGYVNFINATLINTNAVSDIVLNIASGVSGYNVTFQGCTVNDHITFNISGSDVFYEGHIANQFNGNVTFNIAGPLTTNLSHIQASNYAGNFTYTRTVAGSSYIFSNTATVSGNFNYQNLVGGVNAIGHATNITSVAGMCTMNVLYPTPNSFTLRRFKNQTTGGTINIQNSQGLDIQDDTLKVSSLTAQGYRASAYAYFLRNKIEGNLSLADHATYGGGYYTAVHKNHITGNSTFTVNGFNPLYEANGANNENVFIGNTVFNLNSTASAYISYESKSTYNGNLSILRTVAGYTRAFNSGATITGNLIYNNSSSGDNDIGNLANPTTINGTINMNVVLAPIGGFDLHRVKNQTSGGKINVINSRAFNLQSDSLKVDSLNIISYRGNAYAVFINNLIDGNLFLADSTNYGGGYNTTLQNNTINGNTLIRVYGSNNFFEANSANSANTFNGNTSFQLNSGAATYISEADSSVFNGNLSIIRTSAGYTRVFNGGAVVNGNLVYNNTSSGDNDLGNLSKGTGISGTVNMNIVLSPIAGFLLHRVINQTPGGKINVINSRAFNIQKDSLKVDSLNIISYRGSAYAYFYNNLIDGHLTLADSTTYTAGYASYIQSSTINGNSTIRSYGTNAFYEANGANTENTFNGNLLISILGPGSFYTSYDSKSSITGNVTVNRTAAGYTHLFRSGANVGGNFSFTKNTTGATDLGTFGSKTQINGTININATQSTGDHFSIRRVHNGLNGGSIILQNIKGLDIQQDSLLVNSLSVTGYGGSAYSYFYQNSITGNVTLQDNAGYTNGYATYISNNTITGNSSFTILGTNNLYESNDANLPNTYNGNVVINGNGTGGLYICSDAKSTFNGNLNISRNTAGVTDAFTFGASINGNLSFVKNVPGISEFGHTARKTSISGTINMSVSQTLGDEFNLFWVKNETNGGGIDVQNTKLFNIQKDSLQISNLSISNYGGSGYSYLINNLIEGDLGFSDHVNFGNGYATYVENNTISGNTVFTNNGFNQFYDGAGANNGNIYLGNISYIRNGGDFNIGTGDTNSYAGNFTLNSSNPVNANLIQFIGNSNNTISQLGTAPINIQRLIMNKPASGTLTLNKPVYITNSCHFISGDIISTLANPLAFLNNTTHNGANDNSHVMGTVSKFGDDAFNFPLGNGIGLNTIAITAPGAVTDTFQASLVMKHPDADGYPIASKDPALLHIVPFHYWSLNRISGSNPISVTLGWGNPCVNAGITNLPTLAVSRWNGTSWDNLGNSAVTGTPSSGTVTMVGNTTSFGPFDLASTSNLNQWSGSVTTVSGTNSPICPGAGTVLTAAGAATYTWEPGGLSGNPVTVYPLVTTTYTVTGASGSGCLTTATKTITVTNLPALTTTASTTAVCTGGSASITVSGANSYVWQPGSLTGATNVVSPAVTTIYTITGTHAGGCTNTTTRMITVGTCAACGTGITITTSPYSILLTESTTFIQTSGTVLIESGSFVKFDAAPASYVLLNPGFWAKTGSVFIAQALNGCSPGSPQMPFTKSEFDKGSDDFSDNIFIYPNPTTGKITIAHPTSLREVQLFDMMGKKVMQVDLSGNAQTDIDISQFPNGVYLLYAKGFSNIKIIKN